MDIAFSAERSIEDGIEEISQAEVSTVVISYAVMFIYIAIALGKIRSFRYLMVCKNRLEKVQRNESTVNLCFHRLNQRLLWQQEAFSLF